MIGLRALAVSACLAGSTLVRALVFSSAQKPMLASIFSTSNLARGLTKVSCRSDPYFNSNSVHVSGAMRITGCPPARTTASQTATTPASATGGPLIRTRSSFFTPTE